MIRTELVSLNLLHIFVLLNMLEFLRVLSIAHSQFSCSVKVIQLVVISKGFQFQV